MTHNIYYSSIYSLSNICFFLLLYAVWTKCLPNSLPHFQIHLKMIWPVFIRPTLLVSSSKLNNLDFLICTTDCPNVSIISSLTPRDVSTHVYSVAVSWRGPNRKMRRKQGRCYKCLGGLSPFYQMFFLHMCFLLRDFTLESCWQHLWHPHHPESLRHVAFTDALIVLLLSIGHRYGSTKDILNVIQQFCLLLAVKLKLKKKNGQDLGFRAEQEWSLNISTLTDRGFTV